MKSQQAHTDVVVKESKKVAQGEVHNARNN